MAFTNTELTEAELVAQMAANTISHAASTESSIIRAYVAGYRKCWRLDEAVTVERLQAIFDKASVGIIEILTKSAQFVAAFSDDLDPLYRGSPYEVDTVTEPGRVIIGDMKQIWVDELAANAE